MKHRTIRSTTRLAVSVVLSLIFSNAAYGVKVIFVSAPVLGIAPYNAAFQVIAIEGEPPYNYTWDFGDGQPTNTAFTTVQHVYSTPGTYAPIVTVFDKFGFSASATNQIQILAPYSITDFAPSDAGFIIEWALLIGQDSIVQQTTNLMETPFTDFSKVLPYPTHSYTDTLFKTKSMRFYRIVAPPE